MTQRLLCRCASLAVLFLLGSGCALANDETQPTHLSAKRVVAFADVHGAYEDLLGVLQQSGVVDSVAHWAGGDTHLVSLGDILDRGARSRDVLDLLMSLQKEAADAGGTVSFVLGNHESMIMTGDLRYVSDAEIAEFEADETAEQRTAAFENYRRRPDNALLTDEQAQAAFDQAYPAGFFARLEAFSPGGRYGSWLLDQSIAIVIDDTLFVHGGLAPILGELPAGQLNPKLMSEIRQYAEAWYRLTTAGYLSPGREVVDILAHAESIRDDENLAAEIRLEAARLVQANEGIAFSVDSPLWYRGTVLCYRLSENSTIEKALQMQGVQRVVVGHTPTASHKVETRNNGKIIMLDTGMLTSEYGGRASALIIEEGELRVAYLEEDEIQAPVPNSRTIDKRPGNMSDQELEEFLLTAKVVNSEAGLAGVTKPQMLTLNKDGMQIDALFNTESTEIRGGRGPNKNRMLNAADRWQYEVAAYKLDRILGLGMVPVAVERNIDGQVGALIFRTKGLISLLQKNNEKITADGWCPLQPQHELMYVWDTLIYNEGRTQQNVTYTAPDWMLRLIGQSRSFRTYRDKPPYVRERKLRMTQEMANRLKSLDSEQLTAELGEYLNRDQIRALLRRRNLLINSWAEIQTP